MSIPPAIDDLNAHVHMSMYARTISSIPAYDLSEANGLCVYQFAGTYA